MGGLNPTRKCAVNVCRRLARWLGRLYVWATYRLYHECAWAYDPVSWLVSLGHWSSWRRTALDHVIGHRILEVGFGTGELLTELAHRRQQVVGLEPSPAMHNITAHKMRRCHRGVPRVRGVAQQMPFVNGVFDSIISTFPTGYILDPATLREVARLLRPPDISRGTCGGRFIIVGMYFEKDSHLLDRLIYLIFGPSAESALAIYEQMAAAAGLSPMVIAQQNQGQSPRVPVVISEKHI